MKHLVTLLSFFCLLWAGAVWAAPPFPQGYVLPDAQVLQPGKIQVSIIATSLKGKKGALYLPKAFPGELAVTRDGTLYMAGGMSGGDSPLMRITPDGKASPLLKPKVISTAEGEEGEQVPYFESVGPIIAISDDRLIFLYRGLTVLDLRHPDSLRFQPVLRPNGQPFRGDEKGYPDMYLSAIGTDGYFYVGNGVQWVRVDAQGVGYLLPPSALNSIPLVAQLGLYINTTTIKFPSGKTFEEYPGPNGLLYYPSSASPAPRGWAYFQAVRGTREDKNLIIGIFRTRLVLQNGKPILSTADLLYTPPKGWHIESMVGAPNGDIYTGIASDKGVDRWMLLKLSPAKSTAAACSQATTPTEGAICADPDLKKLDTEMADAYHRTFTANQPNTPARKFLIDSQRRWLQTRDACQADVACIKKAYQKRIQVLKGS